MTFHRIANALPAKLPDVPVRLYDVADVLDKHILTFSQVAGGRRTEQLLRAIRAELVGLADKQVTP